MNYTAEHFDDTSARVSKKEKSAKSVKPKKKKHIYPIVLLGIFTALMFLSTLVWNFTWEQLELYESGHIKHAEEKLSENSASIRPTLYWTKNALNTTASTAARTI